MANYNTFVVVDCKSRNILLVTSSAKLANSHLKKGIRIEVWNWNRRVEKIYEHTKRRERHPMGPYIDLEKENIRRKQARAEQRNLRKKQKLGKKV